MSSKKFSELESLEAELLKDIMLKVFDHKYAEYQYLSNFGLKLILIGNGTGVILLSTLIGIVLRSGGNVEMYIVPVISFLIGIITGALIYMPLIAVSNDGLIHYISKITEVAQDKISPYEIGDYGLNNLAKIIIRLLIFISVISFITGSILIIMALIG